MQLYLDITKAEQRIVEGIGSTEAIDSQPGVWEGHAYAGDVVDVGAIEAALPDYLEWANIREMHEPSAVGVALKAAVIDGKLRLTVKVVDDSAWRKVKEKVYKGFSIGGKIVEAILEKLPDGTYIRRILKLLLTEISLVDRPANPDARILLYKMEATMPPEETPKPEQETAPGLTAEQLAGLRLLAGNLATLQPATIAKAATDPAKIVAMIQAARNELELSGDMEGAALFTQAIALVQQAAGEAEGTPEEEATEPPGEAQAEGDAAPGQFAQRAKATLKKAGRTFSAANLAAMENTVKTLLQMMAGAGNAKAQKAMAAYQADDTPDMTMAIGAEFTKAMTPIAQALLNVNDRLSKVEALPAAGGPMLRPVPKQIAGQPTIPAAKPAMPNIIKSQLDDLQRRAHTDPNPTLRLEYQKRHDELAATYS
jgi:hypothetical protein